MKAIRMIPILSLFALASAAYVWMHTVPNSPSVPVSATKPGEAQAVDRMEVSATNMPPREEETPVQPLEERGDAMLFEIDALQHTPFDESIVKPYD